ncbi:TIGR02099 family protein [Endozoicomonas sp. OPT23]|uniref:YhdP family protein n=1 Tax=Endozoicomonas sp. OPT23 TaxID=2072845 RepID=UPI00129B0EB2|nr:YhdP family protein [Endozoicomonas sp. OPT23]MRI32264.1 TIGR02099 family protein [Endozoicomonas sp. OPT23]
MGFELKLRRMLRATFIWSGRLLISALLLLVVGVLAFRLFLGLVPYFKENMVTYLNDKLNTSFVVGELDARWGGGNPSLMIRDLALKGKNNQQAAFEVKRLDAVLDIKASLLALEPVFSYLEANDIALRVESDSEGIWSLKGIQFIRDDDKEFNPDRMLQFLQRQKYIDVTNFELALFPYNQAPVFFEQKHLSLEEEVDQKRLSARFIVADGEVIVSAEGNGVDRRKMAWSGTISANNLNLGLICRFTDNCGQFQSAKGNISFDWHFRKGKWYLKGLGHVSDINYTTEKTTTPEFSVVSEFQVHGDVLSEFNNWQLQLNDLELQQKGELLTGFDLALNRLPYEEHRYSLDVDRLALAESGEFLKQTDLLPGLANNLMDILNPQGYLHQLSLQYYPERRLRDRITLSANLQQVSVGAWYGAPSGENINGQLTMGLLDGNLELDSTDFSLGLKNIFRDAWKYNTAKAALAWNVSEDRTQLLLSSDDIRMTAAEGDLRGVLKLDIPLIEQGSINMDLDVTLTNGDASQTGKYLPVANLSPKLVNWLDNSIKGAKVKEGKFSWHGSLESSETDGSEWELFFDLENARFDYDARWPEIYQADGQVWADTNKVKVELDSARVYQASLKDVSAVVEFDKDINLSASSRVQAAGEDLVQLFTQSPVRDVLGQEVDNWAIQGDFDGALSLNIPLRDPVDSKISVSLDTENASFRHKKIDLSVDQIRGKVDYTSDQGLTADRLKARLFDSPVTTDIESEFSAGKLLTHFDWAGRVSIDALQQWLKLDALSLLEGFSTYRGKLTVGGENPLELVVHSDLKGMELELPEPLDISADRTVPTKLNYSLLSNGRQKLALQLSEIGNTELFFDNQYQLSSALVNFGDQWVQVKPKTGRVLITGQIEELDLAPWYQRFKNQPVGDSEKSVLRWLEIRDLWLGSLFYKNYELQGLNLNLEQKGSQSRELQIDVSSNQLAGRLLIPEDTSQPYQLALDKLHLPKSDESDKNENSSDFLESFDPRQIPDFDISIKELKVGNKKTGAFSVELRDAPGGKKAESLQAEINGLDVQGDLDWLFIEGQPATRFHGSLSGAGIKEFQQAAGFSPFVSAQRSRIDTELKWQGSPANINMNSLEGYLRLKLKNGKVHKLEGGAGALKLFGILNMEALTRRLRLDFSDLYRQGISFDQIKGVLKFDKGLVSFDEPLVIAGPSSDFKMAGEVDTEKNKLDVSLVVTLPVTSNLPILSVLLGTAPQVAGIIYIADKLVGDQVDKLASIRYRIEGSLDNPEVSLDKLFAGDTKKKSKKK